VRAALVATLACAAGCRRAEEPAGRTVVRMEPRRDCQWLVMPEECMQAVVAPAKKRWRPGWH
jgi:hypothetical protein